MVLTDESEMPFGAHKGKKMANVPAKYLLWVKENIVPKGYEWTKLAVIRYIDDNIEVIRKEAAK